MVKFLNLLIETEVGRKSFVPRFSSVLYALDYVFDPRTKAKKCICLKSFSPFSGRIIPL